MSDVKQAMLDSVLKRSRALCTPWIMNANRTITLSAFEDEDDLDANYRKKAGRNQTTKQRESSQIARYAQNSV